MESFISTLPPYVHDYINKYPATECFKVLKELISFAVLYSNERERINILSLDLIKKGADQAVIYKPYVSSILNNNNNKKEEETQEYEQQQQLINNNNNKNMNKLTTTSCTPDILSTSPIQELSIPDSQQNIHNNNNQRPKSATMTYTFPKWWYHDDTIDISSSNDNDNNNRTVSSTKNNNNDIISSIISHTSSPSNFDDNDHDDNRHHHPIPEDRPMNITTWVPMDYGETKPKPKVRPLSVHNPVIPDLRSYLDSGKPTQTKKSLVQQTKDETKASRRMSAPVPALSTNKSKRLSQQPIIHEIETSSSPTTTATPPLSQSMSRTTTNSSISSTTRSPPPPTLNNNNNNNNNNNTGNVTPTISRSSSTMTRSHSTRSNNSATSSTSSTTIYRPGQTATVRARQEAAKKRQLQLEEEKKKKEREAKLMNRTSSRLKQQVNSGIDWDAIKKERRKTIL